MSLETAKTYLNERGLSPQVIMDRECQCSRCQQAKVDELLEIVKRAISEYDATQFTLQE